MIERLLADTILILKLYEDYNLPITFSKSIYFNQPLNMLVLYYTPSSADPHK